MEPGDVATWVGSTAAVVAAAASVAVWWRERGTVTWEFERRERQRSFVHNVGKVVARDVHVRIGSAGNDASVDEEVTVAAVAPGEVIPVLALVGMGAPADYSLVVSPGAAGGGAESGGPALCTDATAPGRREDGRAPSRVSPA